MKFAPSQDEVRTVLTDMLAGRTSKEDAATWAGQWVFLPSPEVEDRKVWRALKQLSGADLKVSPTEYLHSEPDFHAWLDALES